MHCACDRCQQHVNTLGLSQRALSRATLRKAFLAAAKRWHPDRFENDPTRRHEAEERFKLAQVAYRELWEHVEKPLREAAGKPVDTPPPPGAAPKQPDLPPIFFGGVPGCFVAPHFPQSIREVIASHLQDTERAVAFIHFSGGGSGAGDLSEYMLLTSYRMFVRDRMGIVALLWYTDLGEIRLVDLHKGGKPGLRQRIVARLSGIQQRYALEILRHTGTPFYTLAGQADDTVKKVIYNFLRQVKPQPRA